MTRYHNWIDLFMDHGRNVGLSALESAGAGPALIQNITSELNGQPLAQIQTTNQKAVDEPGLKTV